MRGSLLLGPDHATGRLALGKKVGMVDYNVYQRGEEWVGRRTDASRISISADTQAAAYDAARDLVARNGGGEISLHGRDGRIRDKNTIAPAKDPRNTKG